MVAGKLSRSLSAGLRVPAGGGTAAQNSDSWQAGYTPVFTDMAQDMRGAADGTCDVGTYCPTGASVGSCSNRNPGGGGGAVEDPDCAYDYEFRDVFNPGGSKYFPSQACWDFCTNYVHDADTSAKRCGVRNALYKGGEIHCGFVGGKYLSDRISGGSPYYARCHMFASSGHIETIGGETGASQFGRFKYGFDGRTASHNAGPYDGFVMVRRTAVTRLGRSPA